MDFSHSSLACPPEGRKGCPFSLLCFALLRAEKSKTFLLRGLRSFALRRAAALPSTSVGASSAPCSWASSDTTSPLLLLLRIAPSTPLSARSSVRTGRPPRIGILVLWLTSFCAPLFFLSGSVAPVSGAALLGLVPPGGPSPERQLRRQNTRASGAGLIPGSHVGPRLELGPVADLAAATIWRISLARWPVQGTPVLPQ